MTTMTLTRLQTLKSASRKRLEDAIAAIAEKTNPVPLLVELRKELEAVLVVYSAEDSLRLTSVPVNAAPAHATSTPTTSKKKSWLSKALST